MLLKYFLGLTLMQLIAATMVAIWFQMPSLEMGLVFAGLVLVTNLFATLWLSSLAWGDARQMRAKSDMKYKVILQKKEAQHREAMQKQQIQHKEAMAKLKNDLMRERERKKHLIERETAKAVETARKEATKETGRIQAKANFKVGTAVVGLAGLGGMLLLTQLISLGVILMAASGGALGGYIWRLRHERRRDTQTLAQPTQHPIAARIINRDTTKAISESRDVSS